MSEDEKFVREHFDGVWLRGARKSGCWVQWGEASLGRLVFSEAEAWSAAAAFTRQRLEEIRQVEEEIENIRSSSEGLQENGEYYRMRVFDRILAREQAALAELKRGMK